MVNTTSAPWHKSQRPSSRGLTFFTLTGSHPASPHQIASSLLCPLSSCLASVLLFHSHHPGVPSPDSQFFLGLGLEKVCSFFKSNSNDISWPLGPTIGSSDSSALSVLSFVLLLLLVCTSTLAHFPLLY